MLPGTRAGWIRLLVGSLGIGAICSIPPSSVNPGGISGFVVSFIVGTYLVRAWERRRATGQGGIPNPVDIVKEPWRSGMDYSKQFEGSPYRTNDKVNGAGIVLIFLGVMIEFPLLMNMQLRVTKFLGDLQEPIALAMIGIGLVILIVRYRIRGVWR